MTTYYKDTDHTETQEWLDAFASVIKNADKERAKFLLQALYNLGVQENLPFNRLETAYINTIPAEDEPTYPGDLFMERKLRALIRYNALAMVMRANQNNDELGGHLATFASSATLYETGFNHFWRAPNENFGGGHNLLPRSWRSWYVCTLFYGRAFKRRTAQKLPSRSGW